MGKCTYCGENAGFLKNSHQLCSTANSNGLREMVSAVQKEVNSSDNPEDFIGQLRGIAERSYHPEASIHASLIRGWSDSVEYALSDHVISVEEEDRLSNFLEKYRISKEDADVHGAYTQLVQGAVIRELTEGNIPSRMNVEGQIPFNLQKSESLVWIFQDVPYYEYRIRRERVGSASGFSVPLVKGVYYHTGGFKSRHVEISSTDHMDTGLVGITTKHIYFSGSTKSFRTPYSKIVSFEPYSDGIGIMRDAASAKPQTFTTGSGWFVYNLVSNLSQLAS